MRKILAAAQLSLLGFCILVITTSAFAQNNKGAIVGTVKDPNDAVVPKAQIKVTSLKTGEVRNAESNDDGTFTVTNLEPGIYDVAVEATGFEPVTFQALHIETNSRMPLDVKFNVAGGTGTVTVTAEEATVLESETSVRGDLITGRQVTDLPIPQRNFTLLAGLSPG